MNKNRPVNLELSTIHFPITAIVSILHRISGAVLLGGILVLMWMLDASLSSEEGFESLANLMGQPVAQIIVWLVLLALIYHMLAGIRHLIMDMNIGEGLQAGRMSSAAVLILTVVLAIAAGVWILW